MSNKQEPESPVFYKGDFSFINKDASNINNNSHNATVLWHVVNKYETYKKQEQVKKSRTSSNAAVRPLSSLSRPTLPVSMSKLSHPGGENKANMFLID